MIDTSHRLLYGKKYRFTIHPQKSLYYIYKLEWQRIKTMDFQEDVKVKINSKSESSHDNDSRKELLWEKREEVVLFEWQARLVENSIKHGKKGKKTKRLYNMITVPSIIIPLIGSGLSNILQPFPIATSSTLILTSILVGVNGFFNFGAKTEKHLQYEASYMKLSNEIQKELCKPKSARVACDLYMQIIMSEMNKLDENAPDM